MPGRPSKLKDPEAVRRAMREASSLKAAAAILGVSGEGLRQSLERFGMEDEAVGMGQRRLEAYTLAGEHMQTVMHPSPQSMALLRAVLSCKRVWRLTLEGRTLLREEMARLAEYPDTVI